MKRPIFMMKKILIIKAGSSFPSLVSRRGDFEDWILSGMQISPDQAMIVDVCQAGPLPVYHAISGVVITGSHAMVTEHQAWSERTAAWLPGAIERGIPTLGICYGHQLLAYAMGG
ncbi:MAG: gamma-glutamyl-gamma-aminobutyrate hydrolase family protein, partial [Anaerolineales bacterium]